MKFVSSFLWLNLKNDIQKNFQRAKRVSLQAFQNNQTVYLLWLDLQQDNRIVGWQTGNNKL